MPQLHAIQLDRQKWAGLQQDLAGTSRETRTQALRSCQTVVGLPEETVRLVREVKCPDPDFRAITNAAERVQLLRQKVLVDASMIDWKGFPARSEAIFTIRIFERLDLKAAGVKQRYTPQILDAEGERIIRHFFTRHPAIEDPQGTVVSETHVAMRFAKRAIAHWMLTGLWPKKQGITIDEQ